MGGPTFSKNPKEINLIRAINLGNQTVCPQGVPPRGHSPGVPPGIPWGVTPGGVPPKGYCRTF